MLKTRPIRHFTNDLDKRWMSDDYFDLVVWYDGEGGVYGFQLSYDRPGRERALKWTRAGGFLHALVDEGDSPGTNPLISPVLVSDQWIEFPFDEVHREFLKRTVELDPAIRGLVVDHLVAYARAQAGAMTE